MPKTILVVEDNVLDMKLFCDLLGAHGYATLQARDGRSVAGLVRDWRPDLILMDIQLPDMSGLEAMRPLKADTELRQIPIVAVTAYAMRGDEERVRAAGCEGYIAKPISIAGLIATVREHVG
jgi:two-component system cell cycle response regulator DivK